MLPPFIIEQIRRREEDERRRRDVDQPRIELPLERRRPARGPVTRPDDEPQRGVVILDL